MSRVRNRVLVLATLAATVAAAAFAVLTAPAGTTTPPDVAGALAAVATVTSRTVSFGHNRVIVRVKPGGLVCFRVLQGSSTVARSCARSLAPDAIAYASSRHALGGVAGPDVRAVIVHLTGKGTVWTTLRNGAFYAAAPGGRRPTKVVKVVAGGARTTFTVSR